MSEETTERSVEARVITIVAEELGFDEADVTLNAELEHDLNADSLDVVETVMAIEEEFELDEFSDEEMQKIRTVGDLVQFVERQLNARQR